ncbi:uncharacterized protein N7503_000474 [Penicillium pulvis]|uniref:uncharacterized protein n=1 Tax=Penicillium pulvis TaxID=1562058 RepID=UPI0025499D10|nr:uncharacterized protein N7503_000474 [Penicillium pulvis]KAJ5813724.1 hypothetical protein N7503_000474 [Penicillium pulvis]
MTLHMAIKRLPLALRRRSRNPVQCAHRDRQAQHGHLPDTTMGVATLVADHLRRKVPGLRDLALRDKARVSTVLSLQFPQAETRETRELEIPEIPEIRELETRETRELEILGILEIRDLETRETRETDELPLAE